MPQSFGAFARLAVRKPIGAMRTMFCVYVVFIFGLIAVYAVVGLEHL